MVLIRWDRLFTNSRSNNLFVVFCTTRSIRSWLSTSVMMSRKLRWNTLLDTILISSHFNRIISALFGSFWSDVSTLGSRSNSSWVNSQSNLIVITICSLISTWTCIIIIYRFVIISRTTGHCWLWLNRYRHGLVHLILNCFASAYWTSLCGDWRLINVVIATTSGSSSCCGWILAATLRCKSFSLRLIIGRLRASSFMSWKCFPHVLVSRVFLIYQVVRGCYVIMPICLQAPDRIVLFKAIILNESFEQILAVGHLLKTGEETRLTLARLVFFDCVTHVGVTTDVGNPVTRLRVGVQDLTDDVFALRAEELGHLVICGHNLLVKIRSLWILKRQITCYHGVKNDPRRPDVGLETVVSLSLDHL